MGNLSTDGGFELTWNLLTEASHLNQWIKQQKQLTFELEVKVQLRVPRTSITYLYSSTGLRSSGISWMDSVNGLREKAGHFLAAISSSFISFQFFFFLSFYLLI